MEIHVGEGQMGADGVSISETTMKAKCTKHPYIPLLFSCRVRSKPRMERPISQFLSSLMSDEWDGMSISWQIIHLPTLPCLQGGKDKEEKTGERWSSAQEQVFERKDSRDGVKRAVYRRSTMCFHTFMFTPFHSPLHSNGSSIA